MPAIDVQTPADDEQHTAATTTEEPMSPPTTTEEALPTAAVQSSAPAAAASARPAWRSTRTIGEIVLVLLVLALGAWVAKLQADKHTLAGQLSAANATIADQNANPQKIIQAQTDQLIAQVGKLMNLPAGETPTVAAVSDADAARKQSAFFANAQNGDKVLMYVKAGEAILYRPSTNKIILVAPLTFSSAPQTTTSATKH